MCNSMELFAVLILLFSSSNNAHGFEDDQVKYKDDSADSAEIKNSASYKIPDMNKGRSTVRLTFYRFKI